MMGHGGVRQKLPLPGLVARVLLSLTLVFATYNPLGFSIITYLWTSDAPASVLVFVGFALALTWFIFARISLMGLGVGGLLIAFGFVLVVIILPLAMGSTDDTFGDAPDTITIVTIGIQILLSLLLSFGLVFSYWVRELTGQSAIIKDPP